ncbi:hypothetical protein HPP92_028448 [Vanilla planifolia]|uniref:Uncharacterized protein n=1 Tax=Vanilla planifolia TaxID=51239 RepID=A0A835P5L2_VANPL|nr:hypothetical protein HPP92_028448 [Vanilla planifolia]
MKTEKEQELLGNIPTVNNMLFSGQVLYGNDELTNGLTSLKVRDCELEQTWLFFSWPLVSVQGEDCFVRLNFRGQLTIIDDTGKNSSALPTAANPTKGEYVLILEGLLAQIYGPSAWSTNVRGVQPIVHLMLPSDAQE